MCAQASELNTGSLSTSERHNQRNCHGRISRRAAADEAELRGNPDGAGRPKGFRAQATTRPPGRDECETHKTTRASAPPEPSAAGALVCVLVRSFGISGRDASRRRSSAPLPPARLDRSNPRACQPRRPFAAPPNARPLPRELRPGTWRRRCVGAFDSRVTTRLALPAYAAEIKECAASANC